MERVWKVFPRMELESVLLVVSQVIIANIDPRGRPLTSPTISSVLREHLRLSFTRVRVQN